MEINNIKFYPKDKYVRIVMHKYYSFNISYTELKRVGVEKIEKNKLIGNINFSRLNFLLLTKRQNAINILNNREVTIIDEFNPIPLVGTLSFGFIDRGTDYVEIRPMTACNLDCIFCSVGEGKNSTLHDFFVDLPYLLEWAEFIAQYKATKLTFLINPQGEPLLYPYIYDLIKELKNIKFVDRVWIVTNGSLLTKSKVDKLINAGLDTMSISLHGLNKEDLKLYNSNYPIKKVIEAIEYGAKNGLEIFLTPVWIYGLNDKGIEDIIKFGKKLIDEGANLKFGIQNYLIYPRGKHVKNYKQISWKMFFNNLKILEEKYKINLIFSSEHKIKKTKPLIKPFKKGEKIKVRVVSKGRHANEYIGTAENRAITITTKKYLPINSNVNVKITSDKDNIYYAKLI